MGTFLIFGIVVICVWKWCHRVGQRNGGNQDNIVEEIEMVELGRNGDNEEIVVVETEVVVDSETNNLTQVKYPPPPRPPQPPPPPPPTPRRSKRKTKSKKNKN